MNIGEVKVLIADDSGVCRRLMKDSLEKLGFKKITMVAEGVSALDEILKQEFNLIISDWNMPKKSGIELLQQVRVTHKIGKDKLPFFMLTTAGEKEKVLEAVKAGASDYIVKPFSIDTLSVKLRKHFPILNF